MATGTETGITLESGKRHAAIYPPHRVMADRHFHNKPLIINIFMFGTGITLTIRNYEDLSNRLIFAVSLIANSDVSEKVDMYKLRDMFYDQSGATAIEYGLIAALIAVAAIAAMGSLGNTLSNNFSAVSNAETNANSTAA